MAETKDITEAYAAQQQELLQFIAANGGSVTQQQFDAEFRDYKTEQRDGKLVPVFNHHRQFPIWSGDEPLLGSMLDGSWGKWLDLLQIMCRAGKVRAEGKPPNMVYYA